MCVCDLYNILLGEKYNYFCLKVYVVGEIYFILDRKNTSGLVCNISNL